MGVFLPEARARLLSIVEQMKERDAIEGLILGGTELPLILRAEHALGSVTGHDPGSYRGCGHAIVITSDLSASHAVTICRVGELMRAALSASINRLLGSYRLAGMGCCRSGWSSSILTSKTLRARDRCRLPTKFACRTESLSFNPFTCPLVIMCDLSVCVGLNLNHINRNRFAIQSGLERIGLFERGLPAVRVDE